MNKWLVKTEAEEFSWDDLVQKPGACWDGVRNVEARNNLRKMALGDLVFVYHTGKERQIVGLAKVTTTAYRDPSSKQAIWSAVDLTAIKPLAQAVTLATIKADPQFAECLLARRARLSVMPITDKHFNAILKLAKTKV
jgi:predicted RNA-binding protein with PUA-like domain